MVARPVPDRIAGARPTVWIRRLRRLSSAGVFEVHARDGDRADLFRTALRGPARPHSNASAAGLDTPHALRGWPAGCYRRTMCERAFWPRSATGAGGRRASVAAERGGAALGQPLPARVTDSPPPPQVDITVARSFAAGRRSMITIRVQRQRAEKRTTESQLPTPALDSW